GRAFAQAVLLIAEPRIGQVIRARRQHRVERQVGNEVGVRVSLGFGRIHLRLGNTFLPELLRLLHRLLRLRGRAPVLRARVQTLGIGARGVATEERGQGSREAELRGRRRRECVYEKLSHWTPYSCPRWTVLDRTSAPTGPAASSRRA